MSTAHAPLRLPIPQEVLAIAKKLEEAGYETWCVGGAVRDNLLGLENADFDLATAARPEDVQRLFRHTVPVGVEHGTVAVLDDRRRPHEVTTFRKDVRTDGRHAVVEFGASLDDDLARRDFTINALAYHPVRHDFRDLFGGREDLGRRVVRAVGDPARRFQEDYLRILRAVRFATRFGFAIDPATWAAARASAAGLGQLSAERVRDEWMKSLQVARQPSKVVELWAELGALEAWLPEVIHAKRDGVDRFEERDPVLRTIYLSADPPATLTRLRSSNAQIERGRKVHALRDRLPPAGDEAAVRRWMSDAGDAVNDLLVFARVSDPAAGVALAEAVGRVRAAGAPLRLDDLAVSGRDLLEIGVPPGPRVGAVLRHLLAVVLDTPERNTKPELLQAARAFLAEHPS